MGYLQNNRHVLGAAICCVMLPLFVSDRREVSCSASMQVPHQSTENNQPANKSSPERSGQIKIPTNQTVLVRLPSNTLLKYTSYKDVSILHFRVPADTRNAVFAFKAFEESKSAFQRRCKPRDVTLHLKASSYPVISPENITFPKNFLNADERFKIHSLQFQSDDVQHRITIEGPQVGNWFAVAFVSWTDPNNDRIEQQGLTASCDTLLLAEMSVLRFQPIVITLGQVHSGTLTGRSKGPSTANTSVTTSARPQNAQRSKRLKDSASYVLDANPSTQTPWAFEPELHTQTESPSSNESSLGGNSSAGKATANNEIVYKFYVPPTIGEVTARLAFAQVCLECPDLEFRVQANAFPSICAVAEKRHECHYVHTTIIKPNQTNEISFEFYVQPMTWHYAILRFVDELAPGPRQQRIYSEPKRHRRQSNPDGASRDRVEGMRQLPYRLRIDIYEEYEHNDNSSDHNANLNHSEENVSGFGSAPNVSQENSAPNVWRPVRFRDIEFYPLLRQTYREFFMFDYDLVPDENGTVPSVLNLTAGTPAGFVFDVGEVYDIGGTLSFAVSMKHGVKGAADSMRTTPAKAAAGERSGILAEKLVGHPAGCSTGAEADAEVGPATASATVMALNASKALPRTNQTIIVCMHLGEPGEPTWPDKCRYGRRLLPASSIVNNTDSNTSTGLVHVPFPENGQWYVTMGLYCHGAETAARITIIDSVKGFIGKYSHMLDLMKAPCACAAKVQSYRDCIGNRKCLTAMNETETLKIKECLMDSKCIPNHVEMTQKFEIHHKFATEQRFALDNCSTSIVFTISSSPCVAGRCGRFGRCYHYMSGGFVFSTCLCIKGYRGWDCSEDSQVPSSMSILLASLLLTLSNLLFLPSIYMAARRKYYTEALIYFFAMFFSIFYHACDSGEDEYSFCIAKIGVLQFCDFYCGLLAIWVTLVAMSHIRLQFVSLLHMLGAILLAFGTELNKQSLWVFLAPALTGICIISASWALRCRKSRKWFPSRKYLAVYMPTGIVLVMVGLVCYAFLQTKQNYHIVHSIWHMVMALSILCLLPAHNSFVPKC